MELLSNGTRANLSDDKGRTGLHFAASRGDEAMGKRYICIVVHVVNDDRRGDNHRVQC